MLLLWVAVAGARLVARPAAARRAARRSATTQALFLRQLARRTWAFFETFVGAEDNWLPPDNVQEHPVARVAHRTSPTNIGLSLLANLRAHDFGYLTDAELLARTTPTLRTMERMERHRGHFYNWYDTQTLRAAAAALRLDRSTAATWPATC